jgi:hypothetical protein
MIFMQNKMMGFGMYAAAGLGGQMAINMPMPWAIPPRHRDESED